MPRGLATSVSSPGGFYGWTRHTEDQGEDAAPVHENSDITKTQKNQKLRDETETQRVVIWALWQDGWIAVGHRWTNVIE